MLPKIFLISTANARFYIVSHTLLESSTSRRMVWSQKPAVRKSPFVCPSGTIWRSLSLNYTSQCPIWLWRYRAHTVLTMPTSWGTCHAKNVHLLRSWIYTIRTNHPPTPVKTRASTTRWLPTHSNSQNLTSATAIQWIITTIHTTAIQCTWRTWSRWTWWFEHLTHI